MNGKTAIVGDGESIMVFKAAGVDAFPAENEIKAKEILRRIARDYPVIFVTEEFYVKMGAFLKRFDEEPYPVVLAVPSGDGNSDFGEKFLKSAMERALGVDILFGDDKK